MSYEAVIGLEVHVQLKTDTKMFCRCPSVFGAEPNTHVCETCLGYPGTLPILNRRAVEQAIRLAAALGASINPCSIFARKNYFYADLPKGYQISQFDRPLAEHGRLSLSRHDKTIHITRLHLEEDAGKLLHQAPGGAPLDGESLVDFNRCGSPLLEIVSEPEIRTPAQAADYFQSLHQILLYTGTSEASLEEGNLRCDANVSIRPVGETALGTRTEIKNLNSFRHVAKAVEHEIERQIAIVESGDAVVQSTLTWDADRNRTRVLRSKEEAHDYRYFPEPDLLPLLLSSERLDAAKAGLPELPAAKRDRFENELGLTRQDAETLTQTPAIAEYFEAVAQGASFTPQVAANWIKTEILRILKDEGTELDAAPVPGRVAALINLVEQDALSSSAGKAVLLEMWSSDEPPGKIATRLGLVQERDTETLQRWIFEAMEAFPSQVEQYRAGKEQLAGFFVGKVMAVSKGTADPKLVSALLRELLARELPSREDLSPEDLSSEEPRP